MLAGSEKGFSKPIVKLAIASIAVGLAVMLVSISIVFGFKNEIRDKVIGFDSHIQIVNFDNNYSFEVNPVDINQEFYPALEKVAGVNHIQVYAQKAGLIKTEDQIQGILLKGVDSQYDWSFLQDNLIEGRIPHINDSVRINEVLISQDLANRLNIKLGDDIRTYFVSENSAQPRGRKLEVVGIYNSGLTDIDKVLIVGDIKHVQRLNNWEPNQIAGFEVQLDNWSDMDRISELIYKDIPYDLRVDTIVKKYIGIFSWLELLDTNVYVILILMVLIGVITMISTLLILILERTNMIGVLKSLGSNDKSIRKIFIYNAIFIIGKGMLIGNAIGLGVLFLQTYTGLIELDPAVYFVSKVPVDFNIVWVIVLNIGTLVVCTFFMLFPSYMIGKISPSKAIRFK